MSYLFYLVSLTKNADIDKYKYSGFGIGFDRVNVYSFGNGFGRNVIIFGVDMSSSVHIDNKGKLLNLKQKILRLQQLHYAQETFQNTGQWII